MLHLTKEYTRNVLLNSCIDTEYLLTEFLTNKNIITPARTSKF